MTSQEQAKELMEQFYSLHCTHQQRQDLLANALDAARRETWEAIQGKLDSLFNHYFHMGQTKERLVVEALDEWCIKQATAQEDK